MNTPVSVLADIIEPINPKELLSQWHLHEALLCTEDEESVLCDNAISLLQAVRTSTEAGQLLSALLCKTASHIQGGVAKLKKMTGIHSIRNSRYFADLFDQICKDGKVSIKRHTRVRTKPEVVPALVRWILSDENVQTVSWTKKKAYTDHNKIEDIPCLSRKRSKEAMWRSYCRAFPDASKRVQHTSFMRVTRALTGKQQSAGGAGAVRAGGGEAGCKYSAHQMHAEMLRRFPARYDTPSIGEIMAGVADLIAHKKKGTVPGLTRLGRKLEDKFPEVFKPLLEECERVHALSGQGKIMSESEAMDWLNAKKPGCAAGGGWPEAMGWPEKMETNVRTVHGRWKKEKAASTSAAGASASQGGAPTAAPGAAGPAPESS